MPAGKAARAATALAGLALLASLSGVALAMPDELLPPGEGWTPLPAAPAWGSPADLQKRRGQQVRDQVLARLQALDSAASAAATPAEGLPVDGSGVVAVVGQDGARSSARPHAARSGGVLYRVVSSGDSRPPLRPIDDGSGAWFRAEARTLDGTPFGATAPQSLADNSGRRHLQWSELPPALALTLHQMPYNARWEVFVPAPGRTLGNGAYRAMRPRPLIYDLERLPPS